MKTARLLSAFCLLSLVTWLPAFAAITAEQAARLGEDLTPLGGERASNAAGTIPAWTGGIATPPAGWSEGMHHVDPFADDQPLYTITPQNVSEHEGQLTAGAAALLRAYPDYKMIVYPSRRSAAAPQSIYDATKQSAVTARLGPDGNSFSGAIRGTPFPIPANGLEVIWNHLARFRGVAAVRLIAQAAPLPNGSYALVQFEDEFLFNYARPDITPDELAASNTLVYFKQTVLAPPRLAGTILLVHETFDQVKEKRRAWVYNAGRRRVTRAPDVAYDNPGTASDGQRTSDQFDMFNGAPDRYTWELVGKRELIVPYNSYQLRSPRLKYDDIIKPKHINQDYARYELHRVWVVEAKLKPGTSHLYSRRTFYIDEDSWQTLAVDQYDSRGELWRVSEAHSFEYYEVPCFWSALEVHTDLQSGRYLVIGLNNESRDYDFSIKRTPADYTPDSLRRSGIR
ncbi:MAG TPA: DUF1329 domain-containing protein [Opitutus sp.]|nr:DUF1329 domain-containing protein [Opitutus sp.]